MNKFVKQQHKYATCFLLITVLILNGFVFLGCSDSSSSSSSSDNSTSVSSDDSSSSTTTSDDTGVEHCATHDDAEDYNWDTSDIISVVLSDSSITADGDGADISDSIVTITTAGTYSFSGTLNDGQIIVNTDDEDIVRLILNGVDITSSTGAPVHINNAEKTMIVITSGTDNTLTDGATRSESDESTATVYSEEDLTLYGDGSLVVNGNFNDGIACKDGLIITSGTITINAVDDGIRGKDYLVINGGALSIVSYGDGMKSDNDEDTSKGYIEIASGVIDISSGGDALQAETDVAVTGGELTLEAGGGYNASISDSSSAKGIKATIDITIDSGAFTIDAADDAIHSNGSLTINDGSFTIATGDDGIHADGDLTINNGYITITDSYEGIESAGGNIIINDGDIYIISSDDGLNLAENGSNYLTINGGYILIDSVGDGLDSNASVEMTDGVLIIHGPTSSSNSAIDYDGSFEMNGGFLVAAGSYSRMVQVPGDSSTQNSVLIVFNDTLSGGTLMHIENDNGNDILTFEPNDNYQTIAFSSPELTSGADYSIYYEGSSSGTETDGLYEGGAYTPGTFYTDFTAD